MIAFDTNVLVYASDGRDAAKQRRALDLLAATAAAVIPWQVACEFLAVSRKLIPFGMTPEAAWRQLSMTIARFPLVCPTMQVLDRAPVLHVQEQVSFWDSMVIAACLEAGVTRLFSEDLPGRVKPGGLEIVNPFP